MSARILFTAGLVALTACGDAVPTSTVQQSLRVSNGGFETGDFTGWTLLESSGVPMNGTMTIMNSTQVVSPNDSVFDFVDQFVVQESSPGLPITYTATDGSRLAAFLQNAAETQRLYQIVDVPDCGAFVRWDMAYTSHAAFDATMQFIAVNIRNSATDAILATPFKTTAAGSNLSEPTMTAFSQDVSAFDGQTIRLDFQVVASSSQIDVALDNIRVECDNPPLASPSPPSISFGSIAIGSAATPQPIVITNNGASDLIITAVSATPPFGVTTPTLPITVVPADTTTINATYTATAPGAQLGNISVVSNDQQSPTVIQLDGDGVGPFVAFDYSTLDFAPQRVGTTSPSRLVTITNTGTSDLMITSATTTAPFALVAPLATTLTPGNNAQVEITFSPTAAGLAQQNLVIASDAFGSPALLPLTGVGTTAILDIQPPMLVFGDVRAQLQSLAQPLALKNLGAAPITITAITSPAGLAVDGHPFPVTLLPGTQLVFDVKFAPTAPGPITDSISIATSQGTMQIPLVGTSVASALVADPATLDLGDSLTGEATNVAMVTLTNVTTGPVAIDGIVAGALAGADVIIDPPPPTTPILPGESIVFGIRFRPSDVGSFITSVDVTLQGTTQPDLSILVNGEGTAESGCCSANNRSTSWWLALATFISLRRRRRHRR